MYPPSHRPPRSASSAPPAPGFAATEPLPLPLSPCSPAETTRAGYKGVIHLLFPKKNLLHLHSGSESAAEGVEDAEAVVQPKCLVVFTEEVDQRVAGLPQLLPSVVQRAQREVGSLRKHGQESFFPTLIPAQLSLSWQIVLMNH